MDLRASAVTCLVFFFIGFLTAPDYQEDSSHEGVDGTDVSNGRGSAARQSVLQRQGQAHTSFQAKIEQTQACGNSRTLTVQSSLDPVGANDYEEFARSFQYLSLGLQIAVATGRRLILEEEWALISGLQGECTKWKVDAVGGDLQSRTVHSISCLRQALTTECNSPSSKETNPQEISTLEFSSAFGIFPGIPITKENSLFHAGYYGEETEMEMPPWPYPKDTYLIDVVPTWERSFGRFWIRSQMAHYVWEKWQTTQPPSSTTPYMAFYWSSCPKLRKNLAAKYGRDATVTQDFGRYMTMANKIRKDSNNLNTIYLLTDNQAGVPVPDSASLERQYPDWHFVRPPPSQGTGEEAMMAGLEILRRADYLVGSFQSQMFRLAAELNAAWFGSKYPVSMRRHWTVDVEWFENP